MIFNVNGTKNIVFYQLSISEAFFVSILNFFVPLQRYGAKEDTKG